MSYGGDGYDVWVMNNSSVTIVVTGVFLHDCVNIMSACDARMRLQVSVPPGRRQSVYRVRIDNRNRASSFRFSYTWSTASPQ